MAPSPSMLDRLRTYKPDQGRYVRLAAFWSIAALWGYGCFRLGQTLSDLRYSWAGWLRARWVEEVPVVEWSITPAVVIAAVVFLAGLAMLQMTLNRPKVADLLIDTEGELRKVTWPTFKDTASASFVVLLTVLILFVLLGVFDIALGQIVDFLLYRG